MRGRTMAVVAVAVVLATGACKGSVDGTFNGGNDVHLAATATVGQGIVLRGADGAVYARHDGDLTKLRADGSVASEWATDGTLAVPFAVSPGGRPDHTGEVLPDGSLVLVGWQGPRLIAIRVTPGGAIDGTYGVGGERVLIDLFSGSPDLGACIVLPDGSIRCAGRGLSIDDLVLTTIAPDGAVSATSTVAIGASQFAPPAPPEATWSQVGGRVLTLAPTADGAVVAMTVSRSWYVDPISSFAQRDLVLLRITGGTLDTGFGTAGYLVTDLAASGTTVLQADTDDTFDAVHLAWNPTRGLTLVGNVTDAPTGDELGVVIRTTPSGALDASAAGGGIAPVTAYGTLPVEIEAAGVRPNGLITVGGSMPSGLGRDGVVVRMLADGNVDTSFSGDGVLGDIYADDVHTIDDSPGRVTVAAQSRFQDVGGEQDILVIVFYG